MFVWRPPLQKRTFHWAALALWPLWGFLQIWGQSRHRNGTTVAETRSGVLPMLQRSREPLKPIESFKEMLSHVQRLAPLPLHFRVSVAHLKNFPPLSFFLFVCLFTCSSFVQGNNYLMWISLFPKSRMNLEENNLFHDLSFYPQRSFGTKMQIKHKNSNSKMK